MSDLAVSQLINVSPAANLAGTCLLYDRRDCIIIWLVSSVSPQIKCLLAGCHHVHVPGWELEPVWLFTSPYSVADTLPGVS